MTLTGYLTNLLKPKYIEQGYGLIEDDHNLYLYRDGKQVATFSAYKITLDEVETCIEKWAKEWECEERIKAFVESLSQDTARLLKAADLLKRLSENKEVSDAEIR